MFARILLASFLSVLFLSVGVSAQTAALDKTWDGSGVSAIRALFAKYKTNTPAGPTASEPVASRPPSKNPVKFMDAKPSGVPAVLADAFGRDAAEKQNVKAAFEQLLEGYVAEMQKQDRANDLAAAMTFFISANMTASGKDPISDAASEEVYSSLASIMSNTSAFATMPDAEKHRLHDWLAIMGGFAFSTYQQAKDGNDKSGLATASQLAEHSMKLVLGVDMQNFSLPPARPQKSTTAAPTAAAINRSGITSSKTTFNDGWTAEVDTDFVRLTKGEITVYLFYPEMFTDATRCLDTADFTWNSVIVPRFNVKSAAKFEDQVPDAIERLYYIEGSGTEKATGRSGFLAMKTVTGGGAYNVVLAIAPSKEAYKTAFPEPKSLSAMRAANRFSLSAADLTGTWSEMEGNSLYFYNSNSGNYAGMSTTALSNQFIFNSGGSYQSQHAYGSTQMGVTRGGQDKYNGRFTVAPWELTLTNRYQGKTDVFTGYFEAVKNGRILHITDKTASGINYHLARIK